MVVSGVGRRIIELEQVATVDADDASNRRLRIFVMSSLPLLIDSDDTDDSKIALKRWQS